MSSKPERILWLVGKGPSARTFDWSKAGKERIGINESVFTIPSPTGVIATDYDMLDLLQVVKTKVYAPKSIHLFKYFHEIKDIRLGTSTTAVYLFDSLGYTKIVFVGFDSLWGNSESMYSSRNLDGYRKINLALKEALRETGIDFEFIVNR